MTHQYLMIPHLFSSETLNCSVAEDNSLVKDNLYDILQIYLVRIKKGQRNDSQLDEEYDTESYRFRVKMMVRDSMFKSVKIWDGSVMWNICPYEKETLLEDAMDYFEYGTRDVIFKARWWWYTHRGLIKRQINTKHNDTIDAMKKKFQRGKCMNIRMFVCSNLVYTKRTNFNM